VREAFNGNNSANIERICNKFDTHTKDEVFEQVLSSLLCFQAAIKRQISVQKTVPFIETLYTRVTGCSRSRAERFYAAQFRAARFSAKTCGAVY